jgi:O-acetyl-ADP-ribose deacetylase (regulator of RNase III)
MEIPKASFQSKSVRWVLKVCNILDEPADVLICSANVSLNLSGGVGADLLGRYGTMMQSELHRVIAGRTPRAARQKEVIAYSGLELPYKAVLHAVAVDGWYHATPEAVQETIATAFRMAMKLGAKKVTLTALGTGFGNLTLPGFALALQPLLSIDYPPIEEVCLCLMEDYRLAQLADALFFRH